MAATSSRRPSPAPLPAERALLWTLWVFVLFEPDWLLTSFVGGGAIIHRIPALLFLPLILILSRHFRPAALYWPLLAFAALHVIGVPFAANQGLAYIGFEKMTRVLLLFMATMSVMGRSPQQLELLLRLFLLTFVWYGLQGLPFGRVRWHTELGNPDAYGPLMAMGIGYGYYYALATRGRWRKVGHAVAVIGLLGVVTSFARGAFLAGLSVAGLVWLRSPNKLRTAAAGVGGVVLLVVFVEILYPAGSFWEEMSTISEGTSTGTGRARMNLWTAAWMVFKEHPILGAGANSGGVVATEIIPYGLLEGRYRDPSTLYNRPFHNMYLQLLAEQGIVGTSVFLWMVVDFFRRTRLLRHPAARRMWRAAGRAGERLDLLRVSLALEMAMAGFLVGAVFYNQTYRHWFYTLVLFAFVLSEYTRPAWTGRLRPPRREAAAPRSARAPEDASRTSERSRGSRTAAQERPLARRLR